MIKRPFFSLAAPKIRYEFMQTASAEPTIVPLPKQMMLLSEGALEKKNELLIQTGDQVKTGEKLVCFKNRNDYVTSPVTGTIASISPYPGDFGKSYTAVSIDVDDKEEIDDAFSQAAKTPDMAAAVDFLSGIPGNPPFSLFTEGGDQPIHTIIIYGGHADLLVTTNQYAIRAYIDDIVKGIDLLKKITAVEKIIIAVPRELVQSFGHTGATLAAVDPVYPLGHPGMIMKHVLHQTVPAGKGPEDLGIAFFSAESVASTGRAFTLGRIPHQKIVTVINKEGRSTLVSASIGTPVRDLLKIAGITTTDKDRLIIGGPLTGSAIYTEDHPVRPTTDAVLVQDRKDVSLVSDYPCINCGECIRICPANVPVNMLIRFLEAAQYETAADEYDLYSCIECGLCSYVCVAHIPIFQYIRLAKHEIDRINSTEAIENE